MTTTTLAISAIIFLFLLVCVLSATMLARKKRQQEEKRRQEIAYRKAIQQAREQEHQDRVFKAETGHIATQLYLAKEAERSRPKEALHWYEKAAMADSEMGMHGVVRVCQRAQNDSFYQEKSKFWELAIASLQGDVEAQYSMGMAYIEGRGIEKDHDRGVSVIEKVANKGHEKSQIFMGDWCKSAKNLNVNYRQSGQWYYQVALNGNTEAMVRLGELYEFGKGVQQSQARASYWYELAAEKGDLEAQYRAGCLWANNKDNDSRAVAYVWLFLAAKSGHSEAIKKRDTVTTNIGVDLIVGLQALAKPIHNKLTRGGVGRHSIMKALNKLYHRPEYFPEVHGTEFEVHTEPSSTAAEQGESTASTVETSDSQGIAEQNSKDYSMDNSSFTQTQSSDYRFSENN